MAIDELSSQRESGAPDAGRVAGRGGEKCDVPARDEGGLEIRTPAVVLADRRVRGGVLVVREAGRAGRRADAFRVGGGEGLPRATVVWDACRV